MNLVEFLRARLDEDEAAAREAGNRRWLVQDNIIELWPEREDDGFMSWPTRADARHAARWEPARVLAEVEAKRKIVDEYEQAAEFYSRPENRNVPAGEVHGLYTAVKALALPYASHPDYRDEWKP